MPFRSYLRTKASSAPALIWPGKVPDVRPPAYTPEASTEIPRARSNPEVPNWRVQSSLPFRSYLRTKASDTPALVWPGRVPVARPATYTPEASTEIPKASSRLEVPNWRVQSSLPFKSYLRTKASPPPAPVWPGRVLSVNPAAYTPWASTEIPKA